MTTTFAPFDPVPHLDNDEVIAEFILAAAEDPKPKVFLAALADVEKALSNLEVEKD